MASRTEAPVENAHREDLRRPALRHDPLTALAFAYDASWVEVHPLSDNSIETASVRRGTHMEANRTAAILSSLPSVMATSGIAPVDGVCQFVLRDNPGANHFIVCRRGRAQAIPGEHPAPDVTVSLSERFVIPIQQGQVSIETALAHEVLIVSGRREVFFGMCDALVTSRAEQRRSLHELEAKTSGRRQVSRIERANFSGRNAILKSFQDSSPIILLNSLTRFPASLFSISTLRTAYPEATVLTQEGTSSNLSAFIGSILDSRPTDSNLPKSGANLSFPVPDDLLPLLRNIPHLRQEHVGMTEFFCSANGVVTQLHRDFDSGILMHFYGRKQLLMFPPHCAEQLYATQTVTPDYQLCSADPEYPDLERYPRLAEVSPIRVVLEPGDALVLPWGWFHHVRALEHVLSIKVNVKRNLRSGM